MTTHHEYSPSKLDRYQKCPGSAAAAARVRASMTEAEWEDHTGSDAAAEGTMLHAVMAGTPPPAPLTEEQQELIDKSWEYRNLHFSDCGEVLVEQRLTLMDGFEVLTEGWADVVGLTPDVVKILDWKYGRMWVSPNSLQGKAYAAAAMQTYDRPTCEFHIYQPRAGDGKPILFTDFDEIYGEVKAVIDAAKSPYAMIQAGDHCAFCPAKLDCTANQNAETALMRQDDAGLLAHPRRLGEYAEVAQVVKKRCDQLLAACKDATKRGEDTGWKIINKKGLPKIVDTLKARDRVLPILTNEEILSVVALPYGKLRDLVADKLKSSEDLPASKSEARLIEILGDAFERGADSEVCVVDKKARG